MIMRDKKVQEITGQRDREHETFPSVGKNTRNIDIFTIEELGGYFNPEIYEDPDLYLFYLCCLTAGLRPGEGRGLHPRQILFDREALIVDGFIKKNGARTTYNTEAAGECWKHRIVPLPDLTLRLPKEHIERKGLKDDDFCFTDKKDPSGPLLNGAFVTIWQGSLKRRGYRNRGGSWRLIPSGSPMRPICGRKSRLGRSCNWRGARPSG